MRDQIIDISEEYPLFSPVREHEIKPASYPDPAFWLYIYPAADEHHNISIPGSRLLCPWGMAAELNDQDTAPVRKQSILGALKTGLKTIREYQLPACRILFAEDNASRQISVWVD
jgi:hypothetical protein